MKEKLIFILPDPLEEQLIASAVLSQYLISRMVMGRSSNDVVIVSQREELHDYLKACWVLAEVTKAPTRDQLESADLVFEFNTKGAYEVTKAVQKHIAESFAIQLGVGLMRYLPPVLVEDVKEDVGLILVADRNKMDGLDAGWEWSYLEEFIFQLGENKIPCTWLPAEASWEAIRNLVGKASVVVGVRGTATLIAAASNRLVMELQPEDKNHKEWFRKKECGTYRMIYGKLNQMTPTFVWSQIEKLLVETNKVKPKMARVEMVNG